MNTQTQSPRPGRFAALASRGLRVFPLKASDKKPVGPWSEFRDREPTPEELAAWDASDFNVGIVTGAPSKICVFDIDSAEAQALIDTLDLPQTPAVKTARGMHLLFRLPPGGIRNSVRIGGQKLDVRGDGGYIVGPGSIHPSGARYEWLITPEDIDFAELPLSLLELQTERARSTSVVASPTQSRTELTDEPGVHRYVQWAFAQARAELATAKDGHRNDELFRIAVMFAKDVAAAGVEWTPFAFGFAEVAKKIGLEDDEIHRTIESAWQTGSPEPTAWILLVQDFVYLGGSERFYHIPSGQILRATGFNGQYGHHYWGKGAFTDFLLNGGFIQKAFDIDYQPLQSAGFFEREGVRYWNTFRPSDVVAIEGDPTRFLEFLEHLVPVAAEREHLLKVIAYTVRNPGRKVRHAVLLRTKEQGVGKSMLGEIWGRLLGESNVRKTTSAEMSSTYQSWIKQTMLVICEELNIGQGKGAYNALKDLITSDRVPVNEKYIPTRQWDVYATFLFLTNLEVPLLIEDRDRRIFYVDSPAVRRGKAYYADFVVWWKESLGVIRWALDQVDLSEFNPHAPPPMTAAKSALIEDSCTELAKDLAYHIAERNAPFDRDVIALRELSWLDLNKRHSERAIAKALLELGAVKLGQHRVGGSRESLWAIRNVELWDDWTVSERVDEFQRTRGLLADFDFSWLMFGVWLGQPNNGDFTASRSG